MTGSKTQKNANAPVGSLRKKYQAFGVALAVIVVSLSYQVLAQAEETNKERVLNEVAMRWVAVAREQYSRELYDQALRSLQRAMDYQEYLTAVQTKQAQSLLQNIHKALAERKNLQQEIDAAGKLINEGRMTEARERLEQLSGNTELSKKQRQQIEAGLKKVNNEFQKNEQKIAELYKTGMSHYRKDNLEKARQSFIEAGGVIDEMLEKSRPVETGVKAAAPLSSSPSEQLSEEPAGGQVTPWLRKPQYRETGVDKTITIRQPPSSGTVVAPRQEAWPKQVEKPLTRQEKIVRSYVSAVIKDSKNKAGDHIGAGRLDQAQKILENALQVVRQNREFLGEELFTQYDMELQQLAEATLAGTKGTGRR